MLSCSEETIQRLRFSNLPQRTGTTSSQSARGIYRLANRRPSEAFRLRFLEVRRAPCSSVNPPFGAVSQDRLILFSRLITPRRDKTEGESGIALITRGRTRGV
jgi:hypothetical protein